MRPVNPRRPAPRSPTSMTSAGSGKSRFPGIQSPRNEGGPGSKRAPYPGRQALPVPAHEASAPSTSGPASSAVSVYASLPSSGSLSNRLVTTVDVLFESAERVPAASVPATSSASASRSSEAEADEDVTTSDSSTELQSPSVVRKKRPAGEHLLMALTVFSLVSASALTITLLMRGTFGMAPREGDEEGPGPSLHLENGSLPSDQSGFRVEFRRPRQGPGGGPTPREPPFISVTMRRRVIDTKEPVITWPRSADPYPVVPADNVTDAGSDPTADKADSNSSAEIASTSSVEAQSATSVEEQPTTSVEAQSTISAQTEPTISDKAESTISAETEESASSSSTSKPAAVIARQIVGPARNATGYDDEIAGEDNDAGEENEFVENDKR